jgi:hypothetical protein
MFLHAVRASDEFYQAENSPVVMELLQILKISEPE